jgi:hypothetical protein
MSNPEVSMARYLLLAALLGLILVGLPEDALAGFRIIR